MANKTNVFDRSIRTILNVQFRALSPAPSKRRCVQGGNSGSHPNENPVWQNLRERSIHAIFQTVWDVGYDRAGLRARCLTRMTITKAQVISEKF